MPTPFLVDTFTDVDNTALTSHTSDSGATWVHHTQANTDAAITSTIRIHGNRAHAAIVGDGEFCYCTATPSTPDYNVDASFVQVGAYGGLVAVLGRMDTTADTLYRFLYSSFSTGWQLDKFVAGAQTVLGTSSATPGVGTFSVRLSMSGTAIRGSVGNVNLASVADTSISAAGSVGVECYDWNSSNNTDGWFIDRVAAEDNNYSFIHFKPIPFQGRGRNL